MLHNERNVVCALGYSVFKNNDRNIVSIYDYDIDTKLFILDKNIDNKNIVISSYNLVIDCLKHMTPHFIRCFSLGKTPLYYRGLNFF